MKKNSQMISAVVPLYNDYEVLDSLYTRLSNVLSKISDDWEIVLVDDGSVDSSVKKALELREKDARVKLVVMARNYGQSNALAAGMDNAEGEIIALLDSDLQDPPELLSDMIDMLISEDVNMVIGLRKKRQDPLIVRTFSFLYNKIATSIGDIKHDPRLGVFRVLKKSAYDQVKDIQETTGTVLSLLYWSGLSYRTFEFEREKRTEGVSGYSFRKKLSLAAFRIFSYSLVPIRLVAIVGFVAIAISLIAVVGLIYYKLTHEYVLSGWTSLMIVLLLCFGMLMVALGVVGEYIGRIFIESKNRPRYFVEKIHK